MEVLIKEEKIVGLQVYGSVYSEPKEVMALLPKVTSEQDAKWLGGAVVLLVARDLFRFGVADVAGINRELDQYYPRGQPNILEEFEEGKQETLALVRVSENPLGDLVAHLS